MMMTAAAAAAADHTSQGTARAGEAVCPANYLLQLTLLYSGLGIA